jgi:hypothetical protein
VCLWVGGGVVVFLYTLLFNRPKERSRQALDREIWVAKIFLR